eukprot:scaffold37182_cov56-Phaeocystis_antarctica.AAC.1
MDDKREKHPVCHKCVKQKVPTTYWCGVDYPGNPGAWKLHMVYHKELKNRRGKHATIRRRFPRGVNKPPGQNLPVSVRGRDDDVAAEPP